MILRNSAGIRNFLVFNVVKLESSGIILAVLSQNSCLKTSYNCSKFGIETLFNIYNLADNK